MHIFLYVLFLFIGIVLGVFLRVILVGKIAYGFIEIDKIKGLCKIHLSSNELVSGKHEYVNLKIHYVPIESNNIDSRDELPL